ncbi:MAG: hypothetical protein PUI10_03540 [Prevotellaceae bacterium]|nr:hypothetical protein [Prevotellaceae bacterium]
MNWLELLIWGPGVAHSILLIAVVILMGLSLSNVKICGVSLGVTWILFAGILFSHFGILLDDCTSHFVKEFGLILFIYSIGIQVGPGFFSSFRSGGITLNILAASMIFLACIIAYLFHIFTDTSLYAMIGVLYGAVTNTPGLGAAQQTFSDMHAGESCSLFAQGYAVAYPLGVVGIILCIVFIKSLFKIKLEEEAKLFVANADRNGYNLQQKIKEEMKAKGIPIEKPHLPYIFLGICLGVVLGCIPIEFPGMPVPFKLGLAGGPLIISILIAKFGSRIHLITYTTSSANLLMREIGICLFMAAVGLGAGQGFIETILNGGYLWVLYGFLITIIPCLVIGIIARVIFRLSYFTIAGMISGATTDPPALAYSNSICKSDQASVAYTTVYPLSMFLRVLAAQVLVLIAG